MPSLFYSTPTVEVQQVVSAAAALERLADNANDEAERQKLQSLLEKVNQEQFTSSINGLKYKFEEKSDHIRQNNQQIQRLEDIRNQLKLSLVHKDNQIDLTSENLENQKEKTMSLMGLVESSLLKLLNPYESNLPDNQAQKLPASLQSPISKLEELLLQQSNLIEYYKKRAEDHQGQVEDIKRCHDKQFLQPIHDLFGTLAQKFKVNLDQFPTIAEKSKVILEGYELIHRSKEHDLQMQVTEKKNSLQKIEELQTLIVLKEDQRQEIVNKLQDSRNQISEVQRSRLQSIDQSQSSIIALQAEKQLLVEQIRDFRGRFNCNEEARVELERKCERQEDQIQRMSSQLEKVEPLTNQMHTLLLQKAKIQDKKEDIQKHYNLLKKRMKIGSQQSNREQQLIYQASLEAEVNQIRTQKQKLSQKQVQMNIENQKLKKLKNQLQQKVKKLQKISKKGQVQLRTLSQIQLQCNKSYQFLDQKYQETRFLLRSAEEELVRQAKHSVRLAEVLIRHRPEQIQGQTRQILQYVAMRSARDEFRFLFKPGDMFREYHFKEHDYLCHCLSSKGLIARTRRLFRSFPIKVDRKVEESILNVPNTVLVARTEMEQFLAIYLQPPFNETRTSGQAMMMGLSGTQWSVSLPFCRISVQSLGQIRYELGERVVEIRGDLIRVKQRCQRSPLRSEEDTCQELQDLTGKEMSLKGFEIHEVYFVQQSE